MSRGKSASKRVILPDARYNSELVGKFTNFLMIGGKKTTAQNIVYKTLEMVAERKQGDALELFEKIMEAIRPQVEVRSRRVGGANYQIPFEVKGQRQKHLTVMWFVAAARAKKGMPMSKRIANELVDAYNQTGVAFKKKEDTHKMAESNRAFAHFAR